MKRPTQSDWVNGIMEVASNLDEYGMEELFDRVEKELFYGEKTRQQMENYIGKLENDLADAEVENLELQGNISELETQIEEMEDK